MTSQSCSRFFRICWLFPTSDRPTPNELLEPLWTRLFMRHTENKHPAPLAGLWWQLLDKHVFLSFSSVAQLCPTLCDPMNHSTPGLPVHHQLPESTQTHVHRVSGAIQPAHPPVVPFSSCPQSFPASGSFPISQPFASGGQSIGVSASASVLPMNTQDPSPLGWTGWIALQSKGLSTVFSNTTVQKHQFFCTQLSL